MKPGDVRKGPAGEAIILLSVTQPPARHWALAVFKGEWTIASGGAAPGVRSVPGSWLEKWTQPV